MAPNRVRVSCFTASSSSSHPSTVTRCAQLLYSVTAPEGDASYESLPCVLVRKMLLNEVVDANDERLVAQVCSHTTQASLSPCMTSYIPRSLSLVLSL